MWSYPLQRRLGNVRFYLSGNRTMKEWENICCCSVANSLQPHELQHTRLLFHCLLELAQTHVHSVSEASQSSHSLLPSSPLALSLSQQEGLFQWIGSLHQVVKVLGIQLQHQSFQWIFGLTSFRVDWFDLLAVQRTLTSLLQHHRWRASILWCSAFFMVPLLHLYMTTGKNHSFD